MRLRELDLARRGEPVPERWDSLLEAARQGLDLPGIHPYFAEELRGDRGGRARARRRAATWPRRSASGCRTRASRTCSVSPEAEVRRRRPRPGRLAVDSCAAEFEARTPYYYLSYEQSDEPVAPTGRAVVVLGSGPNRIGQGIEFDYCCVARRAGAPAPRLRGRARQLEPGDGLDRLRHLRPPLPRAAHARARARRLRARAAARRRRLARRPDAAAARARARGRRRAAARRPARRDRPRRGPRPLRGAARRARHLRRRRGASRRAARRRWTVAERIGYPVLVRPHHVLGGRGHARRARAGRAPARRAVPRRPLPRGCDRARRRRAVRRRGRVGGGDPGARRAGRGALGRLGLRRAGAVGDAGARGGDPRSITSTIAAGARRARPAEPPARARRTGSCPSSRRTRARRGRCRSSRRRPGCRSSTTRAGSCSASRCRRSGLPERAVPTRAWAKEAVFPAERFPGADERGPEMRSTGEVMASADDVSRRTRGRCARPGACAGGPWRPCKRSSAVTACPTTTQVSSRSRGPRDRLGVPVPTHSPSERGLLGSTTRVRGVRARSE